MKVAKSSTGTTFLSVYVASAEKSTAYPLEFIAILVTVVHEIASCESP